MSKEKKILPTLRFPEFVKDGEWEENELGKCLLQKPEYGMNAPAVPFSDNLPTYLRITDISEEGKFLSAGKVSVGRKVTKNDYLTDGDIVLARTGASVGKSYKYRKRDGELVFAGFLIRVKPNPKKLDSELLFQILSTSSYWEWVQSVSVRSGQPGINGTQYANMPIDLPPRVKEQQKIASCLSSLDELIAAHNDKLEALKNHKKGLMQNLFPQEGQKEPNYRFPEFEKDGEWMEKTLGDVAELTSSKRVHLADYVKSGIPFFRGKEISELKKGIIPSDILFISEEQYSEIKDKYDVPKVGDILITAVGTLGNVYRITTDSKFYFKDGNLIWMRNISVYSSFLEILLEARKCDVLSTAIGSSQKALTMKALNELILSLPKNLCEQQKIASCLSALDELITLQSEKIKQLQQHKKGLMQGLFPKIV